MMSFSKVVIKKKICLKENVKFGIKNFTFLFSQEEKDGFKNICN